MRNMFRNIMDNLRWQVYEHSLSLFMNQQYLLLYIQKLSDQVITKTIQPDRKAFTKVLTIRCYNLFCINITL